MALSVRAKIFFISVAVLSVVIGTNTLFSSILFRREYAEVLQARAFVIGQTLSFRLEEALESGASIDRLKGFEAQCRELTARYQDIAYAMVVDLSGKILFHDTPSQHLQVISDLDILRGIETQEKVSQVYAGERETFYDFIIPVFDLDEEHVAAVRIGFPFSLISQKTGNVIRLSVGLGLVFFGLGILLLIISINFWVAKPLGKLLALIQDMGQQKTGPVYPPEIDSDDELGQVASAFNQMRLEIRESDEKIKNITRDLDIKTREDTPQLRASYERLKGYIVERKSMEEALWDLQKKYRTVLESIEDGYYESDLDGRMTFFNESLCGILGYPQDELMDSGLRQFSDEGTSNRVKEAVDKVITTGKPAKALHFEIIRKDGNRRHLEASVSLAKDSKGRSVGLRGIIRDITARRRMEEALQSEKEKFRVIVEEAPLGICSIGKEGRFRYLNPAFIEMFGYTPEDLPTMEEWCRQAFSDEDFLNEIQQKWIDDLKTLESEPVRIMRTVDIRCKDGSTKTVNCIPVKIKNGGAFVITADLTKRIHLEEQLQQAQKMEAIGTLAGGIAHDFNNLLMAIQGNTSLMLFGVDDKHPHYNMLKSIEEQIKSGSALTSQLLGYARKGKYEVAPIDLNRLVDESAETVGRTRKEIAIHREFAEDLPTVLADRTQIQQVLLNLCINAADAMEGGGDLFLKTAKVYDTDLNEKPHDAESGEYVSLTVTDTGKGMDKETQSRIFDPFFTTKEVGQGTGLGLASSYGIIENHGGHIHVDSEKGRGTTFSIYLPASAISHDAPEERGPEPTEAVRGTETILLVDDEAIVLKVGMGLLKRLGYEILGAGSGEEAIEKYEANKDKIALVILDMVMPEMGGGDVYDRLKEINPGVKVLLSSGYGIDGEAEDIRGRGCDGFIQKPFDINGLSVIIRQLIDQCE